MSEFKVKDPDNVASEFDLWLRECRDNGLSAERIIELIESSLEGMIEAVQWDYEPDEHAFISAFYDGTKEAKGIFDCRLAILQRKIKRATPRRAARLVLAERRLLR